MSKEDVSYERKEEKTRADYDVQWMFDAEIVDVPCDGCGRETTRQRRVRDVFGKPLCVRCWGEERSGAEKVTA